MREILFRGKSYNGEWVYGYFCPVCVGRLSVKPAIYPIDDMNDGYVYPVIVISFTVGQCTGLKDKHGKKIFEGDIVKTKDGDIKEIIYKDYWGAFGAEYGLLFDKESGKYVKAHGGVHFYGDSQFYEVIGNIHDNPELLEE